jgi:alkanesulfonate monooxygenase SsuD/methylene tetrahydromethanopterin reductase-like flavin-dependent oxidoreductase (luciferase family)
MSGPDVGVFLPSMSGPKDRPGDMAATARHAEDLGLESVWVIDQLVAGTGAPFVESVVSLAAAAGATTRIRLGLGVMILPLRPVVWVAKQVASLQHVSHDRLILGVGAGGDRHDQSWVAAGVPRRERGRRTDAALRVLPALVSGVPTRLDGGPDSPPIRLAPAATVPPIVVGGMSEVAMVRAAEHGDGWFLLPVPPAAVVEGRARLAELAAARGRPTPPVTASMVAAVTGDPALPDRDGLVRTLTDPDGMFGMPADAVPSMLTLGGPDQIAARLAEYGHAGAERVVVTLAAGDWMRQAELLAEAAALLAPTPE